MTHRCSRHDARRHRRRARQDRPDPRTTLSPARRLGRRLHPQSGPCRRPRSGRRRAMWSSTWRTRRSTMSRHICEGADAVVFAAGAGPGSGAARKETVDRDAAILLADAAEAAKISRYVMISSMGADADAPDDAGDPVFVAYLRAKGAADDNVRARKALESTIVRPGHLTDDPGTGRVRSRTAPDAATSRAKTSPRSCSRFSTRPEPPVRRSR